MDGARPAQVHGRVREHGQGAAVDAMSAGTGLRVRTSAERAPAMATERGDDLNGDRAKQGGGEGRCSRWGGA